VAAITAFNISSILLKSKFESEQRRKSVAYIGKLRFEINGLLTDIKPAFAALEWVFYLYKEEMMITLLQSQMPPPVIELVR